MTFLWVAVGVLSLLVAICVLALVDQYRTLELIRAKLKLEDNPTPIELPLERDLSPSAIGLTADLDALEHLVLLFLSTSCNTCRTIAEAMNGRPPKGVRVVLEQVHSAEEGAKWLAENNIPAQFATVDVTGDIASALGIDVTPSAVLYRLGAPIAAQTIPSYRQLEPLLSVPKSLPKLKYAAEGTISA